MKFSPQQFSARPVRPSGLLRHDGWRLKGYHITLPGEEIEGTSLATGLSTARGSLPAPAVTARRPGVGFLIHHQGLDGDGRRLSYLVVCWWDNGNELMTEVFMCGANTGGAWISGRGRGSFCVWDLQVMAHERDAYVRTVLCADGPDLDAYLADAFEVEVC